MQVRIEKDVTRALRIEAAKTGRSVPKLLDSLLYPIFFGRGQRPKQPSRASHGR